MNKSFRSNTG